jgi:hypothetical protein
MDIERMKKLAGLFEAKDEGCEPLEKSDADKKSAVDDIKKGTLKTPAKHDVEDFAVVLDDRGNVKVSNEKTIEKKDGEPAKVAQPGKLKLKEAFDTLMEEKRMSPGAKERKEFADTEGKKMADKHTKSFAAWKAMCRGATFDGDEESCRAERGGTTIGDWDEDDGGVFYTSAAV